MDMMNSAPLDFLNRIRSHIRAQPDATAFSLEDKDVSYAELGQLWSAAEQVIAAAAAPQGTIFGLCFQERDRLVATMLACITCGHPFGPLDPELPDGRLAVIQRSLCINVVVCASGQTLPSSLADVSEVLRVPHVSHDTTPAPSPTDRVPLDGEALATVYFTSGSTGVPKAIAGKLSGVDAFVAWETGILNVGPSDRVSQLTTPSFDGFLKDVFVPLYAGGTVCIPSDPELILAPSSLLAWLSQKRVTVLHTVPSVLRTLLSLPSFGQTCPDLRAIVLAGEPVWPGDVDALHSHFPTGLRALNLYGPTETTLTKVFHLLDTEDRDRPRVPAGKPMPGSRIYIASDRGGECRPGDIGEIILITPYRALGYLGDAPLTAQKFIVAPDHSGLPAYRTGDLGLINAEGDLEFVGRVDRQVKIRGARVEPGEVESVVVAHPSVINAAALTSEDVNGNVILACLYTQRHHIPTADLLQFLAARLPAYMLPSILKSVEALPQIENGKIDRPALVGLLQEEIHDAQNRDANMTDTAAALQIMYADVLHLSRVDPDASFFALGGHSLLAIDLLTQVHKHFGVQLSMRELFTHSTAGKLAIRIERSLSGRDD